MEIIGVANLKVGMFVAEPDCPWTDLPFALQGFVVSTPQQVDVFQSKCRFVYIDRSRSLNEHYAERRRERDRPLDVVPSQQFATTERVANEGGARSPQGLRQRERRQRFLAFLHRQDQSAYARELSTELVRVEPLFDDFQQSLQRTFHNVAAEKQVDITTVREGLRDLSGSLQRNPDALMWLLRLKGADQYSYDHAMDVAVYLMLFAAHIGWRGLRQLELGLAGLLQDIGKVSLPVELLSKITPLSEEEREQVRSHVASSLEIIYAQSHLPDEVKIIVARHHERWDGSGYPRGLSGGQIGTASEMAGLVDSFCAMLRHKPYRGAIGHQSALEELYKQRDRLFNVTLVEQFVQCVGLYPIGTLVELTTGEVGVVIQQNRVQRSRPRVLILLDAAKEKVEGYRVIDLREKAASTCRVARTLPNDAFGLTANDYYLG